MIEAPFPPAGNQNLGARRCCAWAACSILRYTPAEIACEIGVSVDTVYHSYIPAGCPAEQVSDRRIWIVGTEFRNWALSLCELQPERLIEQRDQAAAAFLFLSGMRIDAFVSLPIRSVDLVRMRVKQLPKLGVRTKNNKAAITFLYQIPKLLTIIQTWDLLVRSDLDVNSPWYAYLSRDGMKFAGTLEASEYRRQDFIRGLRQMCKKAKIEYRSPHAFRHGHGVFGVQNARNVEELKAVSQNMMHKTLTTTDSLYGNLDGENVHSMITSLGQKKVDQIIISGDVVQLAQVFKV